jgi:hypothetical protein
LHKVTDTDRALLSPRDLKGLSPDGTDASTPASLLPQAEHQTKTVRSTGTGTRPALESVHAQPWYGEDIKVQAIVYGSEPEASLAVINNRTVHRGDVVNGFAVEAIEREAVIISRGGERWRAVLGR